MIAPVGAAAALFALSFGVLARAAGMGLAAPLVMSATTSPAPPRSPSPPG